MKVKLLGLKWGKRPSLCPHPHFTFLTASHVCYVAPLGTSVEY